MASKAIYKKELQTIAFGSCNRQYSPQVMFEYIADQDPDLWIWLGDNIYGDTEDMELMASKYESVKSNIYYQKLLKTCPVIGIWDDHDYGVNDGDKNYAKKDSSKQLMLDFLDVPPSAPVRKRAGSYQSFEYGEAEQKIKIILLDSRYFRDELKPDPSKRFRYLPNRQGDILGEDQWAWLEKELRESDARLHIIGNGIQFIADEQIYEKWANFPQARKRFFDLLAQSKAKNLVLLSGDRHIAEISKMKLPGSENFIYDITASGLTHTWSVQVPRPEPNRFREGKLIVKKNYALLHLKWDKKPLEAEVEIRGLKNKVFQRSTIVFQD